MKIKIEDNRELLPKSIFFKDGDVYSCQDMENSSRAGVAVMDNEDNESIIVILRDSTIFSMDIEEFKSEFNISAIITDHTKITVEIS